MSGMTIFGLTDAPRIVVCGGTHHVSSARRQGEFRLSLRCVTIVHTFYAMTTIAATQTPRRATKSARLVARVSPEDKLVIARAAELKGASLAEFVITEAKAAASRVMEDARLLRLSAEESQRLMGALLAPVRKSPASVVRAKKRYQKSVESDLDNR